MRQLFALLFLALSAAVIALEATSGKHADPANGLVLIWATDDNPVRQEQMALFRRWYATKYHAPIDIRISTTALNCSKVVVQSVVGIGPDLFDYSGTDFQGYMRSGIALDITAAAKAGDFAPNRFWPVLESSIVSDGRQYGVPCQAAFSLIIAHADLLEAAGVPIPQPGWTWDDLVRMAKALTVVGADGQVKRFGLLRLMWQDLVAQAGGRWFDAGGARCAIDSPETVDALTFYYDLVYRDHVMPTSAEINSMSSAGGWGSGTVNLFAGKQAALAYTGRWAYIGLNGVNQKRLQAGEPPLRIVALPPLAHKCTAVIVTGRCTSVNRCSSHREEALRFLEFLSSEAFNAQVNRSFDGLGSVVECSLGSKGGSGSGSDVIADYDEARWVEVMAYARPWPTSRFITTEELNNICDVEFNRMISRLQSPTEAAKRMQAGIETAMALYVADHPALQAEWQELRK